MKNNNLKRKGQKKAAALVEFAILVTVMVPLLLYISFFSELIQFRMKIDEMTYFASWEMASYNMSTYKGEAYADSNSNFTNMKDKIKTRTQQLYSNLDSADPNRGVGYIMISPDPETFDVKMDPVQRNGNEDSDANSNSSPSSSGGGGFMGSVIGKIEGWINSGINYVAGKAFGFNVDNVGIRSQASGGFSISKRMNTKIMTKDTGGFTNAELLKEDLADGSLATYKSPPFTVWVDTWALSEGKDAVNVKADGDGNKCLNVGGSFKSSCQVNNPFARQVQRMSLLGTWGGGNFARGLLNGVGSGGLAYLQSIPFIGDLFDGWDYPAEARMVSINYYYNTNGFRGNFNTSDSKYGLRKIKKGQTIFQSSPLVYRFVHPNQVHEGIKEYGETLEKRRNFYMGNNEPNCNFDGTSEQCSAMP